MSRTYFRFGMIKDIEKISLIKPPKHLRMKKEKIQCPDCKEMAKKFQDAGEFKHFWCDNCKRYIFDKITLSDEEKEKMKENILKGE